MLEYSVEVDLEMVANFFQDLDLEMLSRLKLRVLSNSTVQTLLPMRGFCLYDHCNEFTF